MLNSRLGRHELTRSLSTRMFPATLGEMLDWSDWMWTHCGVYTQALRNAVRYFLGEISIDVTDSDRSGGDERDQVRDDLMNSYRIFDLLGRVGDEYVQWGNSFSTAAPRMRRILHCPACRATFPAIRCEDLGFRGDSFRGTCPACGKKGGFDATEALDDTAPLQVTFWNPRLIDIEYCPTTRGCEYYLTPGKEWEDSFSRQVPLFIQETRLEFLQALDQKRRIKMDGKYFKHLKPPLPSTIEDSMMGWGLPLYLSEFGKVVEILMLKRYNEAILSDYLIPFRVMSPPPTGAGNPAGDPMFTYNMGDFRANVGAMINRHRANPTEIHVAPFPVHYQLMGGEAKALIPIDVLNHAVTELLSAMCIPAEFAQMTLANSGGPPVGLRRFEKVWGTNISALDEWLQWFCDCRTEILRAPAVRCRLVKASIYDDDMSRDIKAKLGMADVISKGTALAPLGVDYASEQLLLRDENERVARLAEEEQLTEAKRQELQGVMAEPQPGVARLAGAMAPPGEGGPPQGAPAGGMPGGRGGGDLEQLWAEAEEMAQQLLTAPASERRSALINLGKQNPHLHAFVKSILEKMEQQAGQQGINAAREGQI